MSSTEDKNGNKNSDSNNEDDVLYSEEEYDKYKPGWFILTDIEDDQDILQLFSEPRVGTTVKLVGKILHISAAYWSNDLREHEFWREDGYDEGLNKLDFDTVNNEVIFIGKVIRPNKRGKYDVALFCNTNKVLDTLPSKDIRRFISSDKNNKSNQGHPKTRERGEAYLAKICVPMHGLHQVYVSLRTNARCLQSLWDFLVTT